jgi:hypothetical protein
MPNCPRSNSLVLGTVLIRVNVPGYVPSSTYRHGSIKAIDGTGTSESSLLNYVESNENYVIFLREMNVGAQLVHGDGALTTYHGAPFHQSARSE